MARLLRLALERPELFTEPAPGTANWPTARDAQLLRRAIIDDRLGSILRRVYPQTDTGDDKACGQAEGSRPGDTGPGVSGISSRGRHASACAVSAPIHHTGSPSRRSARAISAATASALRPASAASAISRADRKRPMLPPSN